MSSKGLPAANITEIYKTGGDARGRVTKVFCAFRGFRGTKIGGSPRRGRHLRNTKERYEWISEA